MKAATLLGPELEDAALERLRRLPAEGLGRELAALGVPVGCDDVLEARERQVRLRMHRRQAREARGRERDAVVAEVAADDRLLRWPAHQVPEEAHELDRGVVGLGARVGEEHALEAGRRQLGEPRGELDRGRRRALEEGVVIGQQLHLAARRLDELGAAVAEVDAPQPRHAVEDPVALAVPQPAALGAGDDARARAARELGGIGERVQVMAAVELAPAQGVVRSGHRKPHRKCVIAVTAPRERFVLWWCHADRRARHHG